MNWEAIGAIGELLGGAGVILTLVYLAFQIRQNTRQLVQNETSARAAAVNASVNVLWESRRSVYENAELTKIWRRGLSSPNELDEDEAYRFRLVMSNAIDACWDVHSQTIATRYSPETWYKLGTSVIERLLITPGGRRFWQEYGETYGDEFRVDVDQILASQSDESELTQEK